MRKLGLLVVMLLIGSGTATLAADFNGDGTNDIGIFRPSSGLWAIRGVTRVYFGGSNDDPMPGDYNGDGIVDIGLFRPGSGLWAVRGVTRVYFGGSNDEPLVGVMAGGSGGGGLPKTGQTTLYRTGDDGDLEKGLDVLHDNADGTVTDLRTGLMWPKDGTGLGYASGGNNSWFDAIDWANSLSFADYTDWRLPNINELKSFQEVTWGHYHYQYTGSYWSSTAYANSTTYALYVSFYNGAVDYDFKTGGYYVVAVRGGE